jgi:predicted AAA+ superfamily ATPase
VDETGRDVLVQACADLSDPTTRDRELRAIEAASSEIPTARATIVTLDDRGSHRAGDLRVDVVPAWEWLLTAP